MDAVVVARECAWGWLLDGSWVVGIVLKTQFLGHIRIRVDVVFLSTACLEAAERYRAKLKQLAGYSAYKADQ